MAEFAYYLRIVGGQTSDPASVGVAADVGGAVHASGAAEVSSAVEASAAVDVSAADGARKEGQANEKSSNTET